jgi:hypothetical protein
MPNPWLSLFIAALSGGLMGAIVNVAYQRMSARSAANAKQQGIVEALSAELRRCQALCNYNAGIKDDPIGPFVQFPTSTALVVSFEEREKFPRLSSLQDDLVHLTLGLIHINQLMEFYRILWMSTDPGIKSRREQLRLQICNICNGNDKLEGVGLENFIVLPTYIEYIKAKLIEAS